MYAYNKSCYLASGRNGTDEVRTDLSKAHEKGVEMVKQFASERLDTTGNTDFYAPMKKNNCEDLCQSGARENNKK